MTVITVSMCSQIEVVSAGSHAKKGTYHRVIKKEFEVLDHECFIHDTVLLMHAQC